MSYILFGVLLAVIVAVAAAQNAAVVQVNFLTWKTQASLAFVIFASTAAGAAIVSAVALFRMMGSTLAERTLRARTGRLEVQLREAENKLAAYAPQLAKDQKRESEF